MPVVSTSVLDMKPERLGSFSDTAVASPMTLRPCAVWVSIGAFVLLLLMRG
jgi:hypothetical protein